MSAVATAVRERPILFSGEMVRALLAGTKTQTRRVVTGVRVRARHRVTADYPFVTDPAGEMVCEAGQTYPGYIAMYGAISAVMPSGKQLGLKPGEFDFLCPYATGKTVLATEGERQTWHILPRDSRLWVREAHFFTRYDCDRLRDRGDVRYAADGTYCPRRDCYGRSWRPSIHMPRWASRILLEITEVRIERVQDISEDDARAEGLSPVGPYEELGETVCLTARDRFRSLWGDLNGPRGYGWDANPWVWAITFSRVAA